MTETFLGKRGLIEVTDMQNDEDLIQDNFDENEEDLKRMKKEE